jgi:hypothetical protein
MEANNGRLLHDWVILKLFYTFSATNQPHPFFPYRNSLATARQSMFAEFTSACMNFSAPGASSPKGNFSDNRLILHHKRKN